MKKGLVGHLQGWYVNQIALNLDLSMTETGTFTISTSGTIAIEVSIINIGTLK